MITFLPQWLKDDKQKKIKSKLKRVLILFLLADLMVGYTSILFYKKENVVNKKIDNFFAQKQTINLVRDKKIDNTYNTMKIALNQSLSSYNVEAINVHNNEVEVTMNFQDIKLLEGLISKIEKDSVFKINSIVPFSELQNVSKYTIGLEAVK